MSLTFLITAGPTQEPIDPVRYISNRSSGKMGYALAKAARQAGHRVILVSGPTNLELPKGVHFIPVFTAREMHQAVLKNLKKADVIIKVAAVADYRVENASKKKIKKTADTLTLKLIKNPDILKDVGRRKRKDQILVGFAAETHSPLAYGRKKLIEKNCDWMIVNDVSKKTIGFGSEFNEVTLLGRNGEKIPISRTTKDRLARLIVKTLQPSGSK